MSVPAETIAPALGGSRECLPAVGVLAVRALRYRLDGIDPGPAPIAGLLVRVRGHGEGPQWHLSTGLYGFLRVPPGPAVVEVSDPGRRFVPSVVSAVIPDRDAVRAALQACRRPPPGAAGPLYLDIPMHPGPGLALAPATTALWGVVTSLADGAPVPGALLRLATRFDGADLTASTLTAADGSYLLVLPGEVADRSATPPVRSFTRDLSVFAPRPPMAEALAADYLAGLPPDLFTSNPGAAGSPLRRRRFRLRAADGALRPRSGGRNPATTVSIGERVRWDVELLA
jgi:hypothetical protein